MTGDSRPAGRIQKRNLFVTRLRVVVCKQPTSISIMGLDTLNMLILILSGVQEFSEQNAGNASPDF